MAVKVSLYWQDIEYAKLRELLQAKGVSTRGLRDSDIEDLCNEHFDDGPVAWAEINPIISQEHLNGTTGNNVH